jgi:membrane-associated phospholipid phosphatase
VSLPEPRDAVPGDPECLQGRQLARQRLRLVCPTRGPAVGLRGRGRPYITHSAIECASEPLDRYSFPSGHTLHAVCFTLLAVAHFPVLAGPLVVLTVLIALSRVILGLHYPTDVAAGAVLGGSLGIGSLLIAQLAGL